MEKKLKNKLDKEIKKKDKLTELSMHKNKKKEI